MAAVTASTYKQYNTALKNWWAYCNLKKLDPFELNIPEVADFITLESKKGLSYGSLNSFRSAVALVLGPEVGEDPRIKRLFKGLYNLKPPQPKYDQTWDPQIVLNFFSKKSDNCDLSLNMLSKKIATLLALITAHRVQTLSLINIENIEVTTSKIVIKIPDRIKTSGPNRP